MERFQVGDIVTLKAVVPEATTKAKAIGRCEILCLEEKRFRAGRTGTEFILPPELDIERLVFRKRKV